MTLPSNRLRERRRERQRVRARGERRQELMWFKIKSLFLAKVTLSLWASAASATWPRITGSHFTACTLVALLPCYPVFRYILFLYPSSYSSFTLSSFGALPFESKVSSAVVRRQPQAAATRQQQSKADTHPLAANDSDICPWPTPPSSSPLSPTNCKLAMTFTLQLLLCLDISR